MAFTIGNRYHASAVLYFSLMKSHQDIDKRSLALAQAVAEKIDADPSRQGLVRARATCARWAADGSNRAAREWQVLLANSWEEIRRLLLGVNEESTRLRQSNPFCDVLSPKERWDIYRRFGLQ
jgi:hypothetical protein